MNIPVLSNIVSGLKVFFKTRRYVAYLTIFVATSFLALFMSILLDGFAGTAYEETFINLFVYLGSTGTIYFMFGSLFILIGADKLWITRRGRGRVTEMKGVAWLAVSFAISVFLSIFVGPQALYFFAVFCWLGWIAFQAYLSSRTSLRIATIAEPKKGGIAVGIGSFILLIIGIGIIAAEIIAALWLIPTDFLGIGTAINAIFPSAVDNIVSQYTWLLAAYALMGLFALVALFAFFRYAGKGAALNISFLTIFIGVYAGYFLVNVMRRTGAPRIEVVDIAMSLFFLVYAMSGIGRTLTEGVEESRFRTRDLGPLLTFFLASGFFFVDSIIAVTANTSSGLAAWFDWTSFDSFATFLFRDVAKLIAFPLAAIFSMLYYLRWERHERVMERAMEDGVIEDGEVDDYVLERAEEDAKRPAYDSAAPPDDRRLKVDDSRRLGSGRRYGEDDDEE